MAGVRKSSLAQPEHRHPYQEERSRPAATYDPGKTSACVKRPASNNRLTERPFMCSSVLMNWHSQPACRWPELNCCCHCRPQLNSGTSTRRSTRQTTSGTSSCFPNSPSNWSARSWKCTRTSSGRRRPGLRSPRAIVLRRIR